MASIPAVRPATLADLPGMAEALAHAFHDDPVMAWLFGPMSDRNLGHKRRFFAHEGKRHLRHPTVFTIDGHPGAAYWDPPRAWRSSWRDVVAIAPLMARTMGRRVPTALRGLAVIEAAHGRQDPEHHYLSVLGTRPDRQGEGIGSALLQPMLDRCDREGVGAYLESSKAENLPFYERHGFRVVEEIRLPKGPPLWPMWRDPQPPGG